MRILLTHRYFWPDTPPYADMLRDIRRALGDSGCHVDVFSSQPSYQPTTKGWSLPRTEADAFGRILRVRLPLWWLGDVGKLSAAIWYSIRAFVHVLLGRHDAVMAATTPPVIAAWLISIACRLRGKVFVYHCQDIHPEILSGEPVRRGLLKRFLRVLDRQTCQRASRIIVLSEDMRTVMQRERRVNAAKVSVINNFFREMGADPTELPCRFDDGCVEILFAGNLGRFQGLSWLVEQFSRSGDAVSNTCRLTLLGDGKMRPNLMHQAEKGRANIRLPGRVSAGAAQAATEMADVAVISLQAGMTDFAYPSKMMGYLCAGSRVLAIVDANTELARFILANELGWVVEPGDGDAMAEALKDISVLGKLPAAERARIRDIGAAEFGKPKVLERWSRTFLEILEEAS
jgi:glycosyltransferase involved in cell wall biosynthesis